MPRPWAACTRAAPGSATAGRPASDSRPMSCPARAGASRAVQTRGSASAAGGAALGRAGQFLDDRVAAGLRQGHERVDPLQEGACGLGVLAHPVLQAARRGGSPPWAAPRRADRVAGRPEAEIQGVGHQVQGGLSPRSGAQSAWPCIGCPPEAWAGEPAGPARPHAAARPCGSAAGRPARWGRRERMRVISAMPRPSDLALPAQS